MSGPSSLEARFQYFHVMLSIKNKPSISIFLVSPTTLKESISHYIPHEKCTKMSSSNKYSYHSCQISLL